MSDEPSRPEDAAALEREARAIIDAYRDYLASPAFQHSVDLMVLVKIAGDDSADIRERRRAAEVLAKLRLQAMQGLAELTGTREQALDRLGLKTGPQTLALTQVNQKIEVVRAKDWRAASPLEAGEDVVFQALSAGGEPAANGDARDPAARPAPADQEEHDAEDPAP